MLICKHVLRIVGCYLATKSLTLNNEWVEVIVGVALGC